MAELVERISDVLVLLIGHLLEGERVLGVLALFWVFWADPLALLIAGVLGDLGLLTEQRLLSLLIFLIGLGIIIGLIFLGSLFCQTEFDLQKRVDHSFRSVACYCFSSWRFSCCQLERSFDLGFAFERPFDFAHLVWADLHSSWYYGEYILSELVGEFLLFWSDWIFLSISFCWALTLEGDFWFLTTFFFLFWFFFLFVFLTIGSICSSTSSSSICWIFDSSFFLFFIVSLAVKVLYEVLLGKGLITSILLNVHRILFIQSALLIFSYLISPIYLPEAEKKEMRTQSMGAASISHYPWRLRFSTSYLPGWTCFDFLDRQPLKSKQCVVWKTIYLSHPRQIFQFFIFLPDYIYHLLQKLSVVIVRLKICKNLMIIRVLGIQYFSAIPVWLQIQYLLRIDNIKFPLIYYLWHSENFRVIHISIHNLHILYKIWIYLYLQN